MRNWDIFIKVFIFLMVIAFSVISRADISVPAPIFTPGPDETIEIQSNVPTPTVPEHIEKHATVTTAHKTIGEFFKDEKLEYSLGFFPFVHAADASFTFSKDPNVKNGYIAELKAQTSGILKILSLFMFQRKDKFISHMVLTDDGKRLQSVKFEKYSDQSGKKLKKSTTEFDYAKRLISWNVWKGDQRTGEGTKSIPEGIYYDDPLCAFYNLRYGAYGDIQQGKDINVKTVPTQKEESLRFQIATEEETNKKAKINPGKIPRQFFVKVLTDKDLFESKDGQVELWLSKDLIPLEGIVKGVSVVGDIRGTLRSNTKHSGG